MKRFYCIFASLLALLFQPSAAFLPTPQLSAISKATQKPFPAVHNRNVDFRSSSQSSQLLASPQSETEESKSWSFNPLFAGLWLTFIGFAVVGPGEFFSPADTAMINAYIENPADPGFSEGFQLVFNYLGIVPILMACLAVPQAAQRGLPPLPFLVASFGMGYAAVGPYLSFRAPPREEYVPAEASWFTRNFLESKALGWGLVAGVLFLPVYVGFASALAADASAAIQSYADLFASSKFVSASSMDLVVLSIAAASLIPRDLQLRQPDMDDQRAKLIGASTLLLPVLGPALYCALRPALPAKEE